jgi:hypothetical protein
LPSVDNSSATGSAPMCLDNDEVKDAAGKYLTALVERYRENTAVLGYDVWNEGISRINGCAMVGKYGERCEFPRRVAHRRTHSFFRERLRP